MSQAALTSLPSTADATSDPGRDEEVQALRNKALLLMAAETVQHAAPAELGTVLNVLRHGDTYGVWTTPADWMRPGRAPALRAIDLRQRIVHHLPAGLALAATGVHCAGSVEARILDDAVLRLNQYLVLLRIGPAGLGRKGRQRSLDPTTIVEIAYLYAPALFACAVARCLVEAADPAAYGTGTTDEGRLLLAKLKLSDFASLSTSNRKEVLKECERMRMLFDRGFFYDAPPLASESLAEAMVGQPKQNEAPKPQESHLPLPDDYVAQMGVRCLWLMRDLAPNLFVIGDQLARLLQEARAWKLAPSTREDRLAIAVQELLDAHAWRDAVGKSFETPPFAIRLPALMGFAKKQNDTTEARWPPRTYRDILALLGTVQSAHYFIAALSMGSRQSETVGLQRGCVAYATDGRPYASGKTYKLVELHEGEWRDWQLPDVAMEALEQQLRLVKLADRLGRLSSNKTCSTVPPVGAPTHLWAQISGGAPSDCTLPLHYINTALVTFAITLGMDVAPGGQSLRSHRFRKTLARLVALALTQAPKLLMDIFGHKSIEMTLYYILTDKDLRAEIDTISRELRVMRAKDVVERMVEEELAGNEAAERRMGGFGGLAAISLKGAVEVHRDRVHRRGDQWGADSAIELAELLTLQGKAWEQVRRGVICTKFPGEAGPCNKSKGRPEPAACQSTCEHRLEEAFLREDVDASIADCVSNYEQAVQDGEQLTAAHWGAQVRAHVNRFADLKAKWLLHSTVESLLAVSREEVAA